MESDDFLSFSPARGAGRGSGFGGNGSPSSSSPAAGAIEGDRVLWGPSREVLLARLPQLKQPLPIPQPVAVSVVKRNSGIAELGSPTRSANAAAIKAAAASRLAKRARRTRQSSSTGCLVFGSGSGSATGDHNNSNSARSHSVDLAATTDALLSVLEERINNRMAASEIEQQQQQQIKRRSLPEGKAVLGSKPTVSMVLEETESQTKAAAISNSATDAQMSQGVAQISLQTSEEVSHVHMRREPETSKSRLALEQKNGNALPVVAQAGQQVRKPPQQGTLPQIFLPSQY